MSANRDALHLLFPIKLGGGHDADLDLDAHQLDLAQAGAETLLTEMFPDSSVAMLADWEKILGIIPGQDETLQSRHVAAVQKIRSRGGLSISYFLVAAQALGYVVEIEEPIPFMAGWGAAGDELFDNSISYQWGLVIHSQPIYFFRAGEAAAGEPLSWWHSLPLLESLFTDLKPAHTFVYFSYV